VEGDHSGHSSKKTAGAHGMKDGHEEEVSETEYQRPASQIA
jgi:hypothetical protein